MRSFMKAFLLLWTALILLSACSASFDEEEKEAVNVVKTAMKEKAKKTNNENDLIEYYLPFGFEVEEETENNIILKNGSKTYILFYNQIEGSASELVYRTTLEQNGQYDTDEVIKSSDAFGYVLVKKLDEELNELTVGVGGVKVTTESKTRSLSSEADMMIEIAKSVKVKESADK